MKPKLTLIKYLYVFHFQSSARSAKKSNDFFGLISSKQNKKNLHERVFLFCFNFNSKLQLFSQAFDLASLDHVNNYKHNLHFGWFFFNHYYFNAFLFNHFVDGGHVVVD